MPLGRRDADRGLDLLWEFHNQAEDQQQRAAYSEAIASLHSYLTDVLPASQPSLRAKVNDGFADVYPPRDGAAAVKTVQLQCGAGEKLGLSVDVVSGSLQGGVSPVVVSAVEPGSPADKGGSLQRGDQLLEVDGRPLAHVSLERARWLLNSAERRGTVKITVIPLELENGLRQSVSWEDVSCSLTTSATPPDGHDTQRGHRGQGGEGQTLSKRDSWEITVVHDGPQSRAAQSTVPVEPLSPSESGALAHEEVGGGFTVDERERGSRRSLTSSGVVGGNSLSRDDSFSSSRTFQRRKVRKMHIMKGARGLGLRIIGGKGSKYGNMGIFIRDIDVNGAAHSDGRLKPGDEILMVDGKSLVGLTHAEAVSVLKMTQKLMQLVVATEVPEDQSISSSLVSIPDWAKNSASRGPPPIIMSSSPYSLSPLSTGFIEGGFDQISPEFNADPHRGAFGNNISPGGESFETRGLHKMKRKSSHDDIRETGFEFVSTTTGVPAAKTRRLSNGTDEGVVAMEKEVVQIIIDKPEGRSLGFTVCRGNGDRDGIFVRSIDPTGLAGHEGSLREGDQLLEANGRLLTGLTHKESASVIRGLKAERVILSVSRTVTRTPSRTSSVAESSSTEMESAATSDMETTDDQREEREITVRDEVPGPPLAPPPEPPPDSNEDTDHELTPPTPPPSLPPPSVGDIGPPPPVTPPPQLHVGEQTQSETESNGREEETEEERKQQQQQLHHHQQQQDVGSTPLDAQVRRPSLSGSDNGQDGEMVTKRRVIKQEASSGVSDSGIEVRGQLFDTGSSFSPPQHGMVPEPVRITQESHMEGESEREGRTTIGNEEVSDLKVTYSLPPSERESEKAGEGEEEEGGEEEQDKPPMGFQKLVLQMKKRARSGLGVTIVQGLGKTKGIFMVRRIMAGGVAARDKRIRPGDRLVAVNNKSLRNLSHAEVLQTINDAPKDIQLVIWRDPEFELDATSSIYSIGSRSSIVSDDDTDDSLPKRHSLVSVERLARDGGRARGSPNITRYSTSMLDRLMSAGQQASPGTLKRRSAVILFPNVGPAGEILSSPTPPPTSPTHTFTPPNPLPSPNTLSPSPVPPSLSPSPEPTSAFHQDTHPPPSPPPSPPPPSSLLTQANNYTKNDSDDSPETPPPPPPPSTHPPSEDAFMLTFGQNRTTAQQKQDISLQDRIQALERNEVERPKSLGPIPKGARLEHEPFEIEITKGIFGLGLSVGVGSTGMIVVTALTSRSPIRKDGNIRVGDHLLSINDTSLIGVEVATAEMIVKGLSRGVVRFVAMAPPRDVTGGGLKSVDTPTHPPPLPSTLPPPPPLPSTLPPPPPLPSIPPPPPVSPLPEAVDEPGIIHAKLQRFGTAPLGLILEGGSDSPLMYIFIQSIAFGSPAFNSGQFMKGDQLVMVGSECLIGMSLLQAKQVLERAPAVVEIVAQRKDPIKQSPTLIPKVEVDGNSRRAITARRARREEGDGDSENESKDKRREERSTGFLTHTEKPTESRQPQYSHFTSRTDISKPALTVSTALAYATSNPNLNTSWNVSVSGSIHSKTISVDNVRGSVDSVRDSTSHHPSSSQATHTDPAQPAEEVFIVELHREAHHKLGLSIVGGADNPSLQHPHVKRVLPDGLACQDGRIKRGDRVVSVNGQNVAGLTNKEALQLLKDSGSVVKLAVARRAGRRGSQAPSPLHSQLQSRRSSGESTREPPSPVTGYNRRRRDSSGSEGASPTPPSISAPRSALKGRSRRESLSQEDDTPSSATKSKTTMPRKLKSTEGIKIVELHKGPTGLGMHLKGGSDENLPITVRAVFPGGTAHKSGKIHPGDVIIEVNSESFENLTHKEALHKLKSYPQGKISLLVRDRTFAAH